MQGTFAERPLLGWPGIVMRMTVKGGKFTVTCTNDDTGQAKFLYEGLEFSNAADAYKHPFVFNYDDTAEISGLLAPDIEGIAD
jgi:hypothetical protein